MCDGFGISPYTFLSCLCVQPRFIEIYGSSGSVGTFVEGASLQEIYSILATISRVGRDTMRFTYPSFQKDYSHGVQGVLSNSQKATTASPHTT